MDIGTSAVIDRPSTSPSYSAVSTPATGPLPQGPQILEVSGLENIRQRYEDRGFLQEVIDTLQAPRRQSTEGAYNAQWAIFSHWCHTRSKDPFSVDVVGILDFLNDMIVQGKALSTLKGYMSAFTAIRGNINGYSFYSHPEIC
jgi:hypothetical protein